ncbi:ATP-dependent DNA helicase [Mycena indigotica]|uniref:ATP-dependent DNA helicase n=1 Tax=Mycena indigotica TaxID=2126181 RepID=A0A8H6VWF6_9AGAR|nr:ATP-dependent DNA helicase [Mycena indigotica]KAF7292653.1 ATP-dependent DNA helicase [Mycena indigotica]
MDIKLMTNSWETKDIAFYITLYIAKKQVQAANASAILATSKVFSAKEHVVSAENSIEKVNKKLLQQCANTLSRQYELSGPEVISYLMGWGDRYISHTFVKIYWDIVTATLCRAYPTLSNKTGRETDSRGAYAKTDSRASYVRQTNTRIAQLDVKQLGRLRVNNGQICLQDQLGQYADRGEGLLGMNVYEFFTRTYHDSRTVVTYQAEPEPGESKRPGRPPSERFPYLPQSERKGARMVRGAKQETALHIVGRWLPNRDDANQEYYSAQILLLLKPWRVLADLMGVHESFLNARLAFESECNAEIHRIIANLQYYHECSSSANRRRPQSNNETEENDDDEYGTHTSQDVQSVTRNYTEEDVERARANKYAAAEQLYGKRAMEAAYSSGYLRQIKSISS